MHQIVGGMFGLKIEPDTALSTPPFLAKPHILLSTARSGIAFLLKRLKPKSIWMPSYLCDVMVKAADGSMVQFYPVDTHLRIASGKWIDTVKEGDLVVFVDYFGFPTDSGILHAAKKKRSWVLEDACQALLSVGVDLESDYVLYSPRKFLGVPDGGVLVINNPEVSIPDGQLSSPQADWWLQSLRASVLRREFDQFGGERQWFSIYKNVDNDGPIMPRRMSELSQLLLNRHFDYSSIAQRRRDNYTTLLEQLAEYAMFTSLPQGIVPLGFPVRVSNRNAVRQHLFEHNIYPPIHWPIEGCVPKTFRGSHQLSEEILTLVCDQRYGPDDMERTASLFRQLAEAVER